MVTGLPVDEPPAAPRKPAPRRKAATIPGAVARPMPSRWKPQLATPAEAPPKTPGWLHEVKYDGHRIVAVLDGAAS